MTNHVYKIPNRVWHLINSSYYYNMSSTIQGLLQMCNYWL